MQTVDKQPEMLASAELEIHGTYDPAFQGVRDEFERNFTERGDVGASVCVIVDGETVVDLWGGLADPERGKVWEQDTLTSIMSVTKGATALCAHMLHDRGLLDIDAPVVAYWPEFGKHGKDEITVRMLLNHQAGLPAIRKQIPEMGYCDWTWVIEALADERLFWDPGTRAGYHAMTFGFLVGEVIRRVSGRSLGTFFREEVAEPLGLDFWIGLPESEHDRVAPLMLPEDNPLLQLLEATPDSESAFSLAFGNSGGILKPGGWNSPRVYQSEFGSGGGLANARSVAGLYAPLAMDGSIDGVRLVEPEAVRLMSQTQSALMIDGTIGIPLGRFTLGFDKDAADNGFPEAAFGHSGWGGANGFADPESGLAFGYVMNYMNTTDRWESLARAAYRAIGYREGKHGVWTK